MLYAAKPATNLSLPPFWNTFTSVFLPILLLLRSITAGSSPIQYDPQKPIAVNCGFSRNSTAVNGRQWVGDTGSASIIVHGPGSKSVGPFSVDPTQSLDPTPYMTARASRSSFTYTFHVASGYKFIRLHFYPTTYNGFKESNAFLTVKSGPYTLLNNFSALLTVNSLGLKFIVKEFTLYVNEEQPLSITFSPSSGDGTFAFVNGIEVVPTPLGLYYTMEGDEGAYVVGQNYRLPISKATAMETAYRLNVGGGSLPSAHEPNMFREWTDDSNHLIESSVFSITSSNKIKYAKKTSQHSAPQRVYQTSWSMNKNEDVGKGVNFSWKLSVDLGFRYMIRLHFCELDYEVKETGQKEFSIHINNQVVEPRGDLIRWGGEIGVAIHKDYAVTVIGDRNMGKRDLLVSLYPVIHDQSIESVDAILKGIEVFKLSNPDANLAGVNPVISHSHASVNHMLKVQTTKRRNITVNLLIMLITFLNVIVYQICEWSKKFLPSLPNKELYLPNEEGCRRFLLSEILSATKNFDKGSEIGHGGFGIVYEGFIHDGTMKHVAIKRLSSESKQGEKEFKLEIEILSKHHHMHIVTLIGYCYEGREMILVYEFMERGSLADHLYKNKRDATSNGDVTTPLSWEQRLNVCLGAARGLNYLHTNPLQETIHRDVKSANILLDLNWVAKIGDFGISKVGTMSNSHTHFSTDVKGTPGYMDPDYYNTKMLTKKSDVYAFGMVLWEVLSGMPAFDDGREGKERNLIYRIQHYSKEGKVDILIDSSIRDQISTRALNLYRGLANQCLHEHIKERPTMAEVIYGIESVLAAALSQDEEEDSPSRPTVSSMELATEDSFYMAMGSIDHLPPLQNAPLPFRRFSLAELRMATRNFSDARVIDRDRFGKCYKGVIDDGNILAAIKETNLELEHCMIRLMIASQINHTNIVKFIGYCNENHKTWLVLKYNYNGSLADHLHIKNKKPLSWKKRLGICIGAAQGLHHLHSEMPQSVIHRDISSANILIDRDLVAKISFFDLSLEALSSYSECGTIGYIDPEYYITCQLSLKSDVYSFGVVLLEVLCAKKPFDLFDNEDDWRQLIHYIKNNFKCNIIDKIIDPYLIGRIAPDCLIEYMRIAMNCVEDWATERPSMEVVVSSLRHILQLQEIWSLDASLDPPNEVISFISKLSLAAVGREYRYLTYYENGE